MSERDTILTAAEVEAMVEQFGANKHLRCDGECLHLAIARLAASHLALLEEKDNPNDERGKHD